MKPPLPAADEDSIFDKPCTMSTHCIHNTGVANPSKPPRFQIICCYCGQRDWVRRSQTEKKYHGSFRP